MDCAIRNRPETINSRSEFGHWEADLMIFRKEHGAANMATVVERKSRYTLLFRNNDRRSKPIMMAPRLYPCNYSGSHVKRELPF